LASCKRSTRPPCHLWANWQHLELNLDAIGAGCAIGVGCNVDVNGKNFGKKVGASYDDLDMFMVGGVIFF
jgi:hypothetical protein